MARSGKLLPTQRSALERGLDVSLAGAKAGGAIALGGLKRRLGLSRETQSEVLQREADAFVSELGRLKGSYVKIGQMFAEFGEHLLPVELTTALYTLTSQTEAVDWALMEPQLQEALGRKLPELEIAPQAMAAASLAQVHRAKARREGEPELELCLKVLYPGLRRTIDADFNHVVRMLRLGRFIPANRQFDRWLESMRAQLHQETDYVLEAQRLRTIAQLVAELCETSPTLKPESIDVPAVLPRYTQGDVLAMQAMQGLAVNDAAISALSQRRRNTLAKAMLELFFAEVYQWGLIQTDPNFGNYLIAPSTRLQGSDARPDQLILLDFGSVQQPSADFIDSLRRAIACGLEQDVPGLQQALLGLGCLHEDSSEGAQESFAHFCMLILEPLWPVQELPSECLNARGQYRWAQSQLIKRAGKYAASASINRHFSLPSAEFTIIARKLLGVFTFISVLEAEFNGHAIARRYIDAWRSEADG